MDPQVSDSHTFNELNKFGRYGYLTIIRKDREHHGYQLAHQKHTNSHSNSLWWSESVILGFYYKQKISHLRSRYHEVWYNMNDIAHGTAIMMTSSNGNIFCVTGHLCGEFPATGAFPAQRLEWRGALMFSLICVWINGWENNRKAGDLRRYRAHYDVIVMMTMVEQTSDVEHTEELNTGLDTNGCPLGNSKFILLSDNLNICLWLSACQVEKIDQINNPSSTIY